MLAFGNASIGSNVSQKRIALARERARAAKALVEEQRALVRALKDHGAKFVQLREVASRLDRAELPACEVIRSTLRGRAGWISAQGGARIASE